MMLSEQRRCKYARQHYLTHLYRAHEWQRLFEVLDTVQYGREKMRDDPAPAPMHKTSISGGKRLGGKDGRLRRALSSSHAYGSIRFCAAV